MSAMHAGHALQMPGAGGATAVAALALSRATRVPHPRDWLPTEPIRAVHGAEKLRPDSGRRPKTADSVAEDRGPVPRPPEAYKVWRFPAGPAAPQRIGPPPPRPVSEPHVLEHGHFTGQWNDANWGDTQYNIPLRLREMQIGVLRSMPWSRALRKPGSAAADSHVARPQSARVGRRAGLPSGSTTGPQKNRPFQPSRPTTAPSRMKRAVDATQARRMNSPGAGGNVIRAGKSLTSSSKTNSDGPKPASG